MHLTRMHGAGNSFVVVENLHGELADTDLSALARQLCSKEPGYRADGMMVLTPVEGEADFGMLFYNADGSSGEMCGNGARCLARYGADHGLIEDAEHIRILATAGMVFGRRITEEEYEIRLNDPTVIDLHRMADGTDCSYIELGDPGIPHAVVCVEADAMEELDTLRERGRALRHSSAFPKGANVTFTCKTGRTSVKAITFERGVEDFTLACGTGCGAAAVSLILKGIIPGDQLEIDMPGGHLSVHLIREGERIKDILLTGPTAYGSAV